MAITGRSRTSTSSPQYNAESATSLPISSLFVHCKCLNGGGGDGKRKESKEQQELASQKCLDGTIWVDAQRDKVFTTLQDHGNSTSYNTHPLMSAVCDSIFECPRHERS